MALSFICAAQPDGYRVFQETATGQVRAAGWMERTLLTQSEGLSGHIEVAGKPFGVVDWGKGTRDEKYLGTWSYYEQTAYWADGALRLAYLTGNETLKDSVRRWIDYQVSNPAGDGFLGPDCGNLWPQVVFFRAMMAEYSATGDDRIITSLARHYRESSKCKALYDGSGKDVFGGRNILNVEILCWLHEKTGDSFFLEKAEECYRVFSSRGGNLSLKAYSSEKVPAGHSISSIEALKTPVILYNCTGKQEYLQPALHALKKIMAYHVLADGVPSGNEQHDGNSPRAFHETCAVSDFQWTLGYFLQATGDVRWADQMEKVCFNAAMGVVSKDFCSHQYYGSPNQVAAGEKSVPPIFTGGQDRLAYKIVHSPACCTGNISRMIPLFCSRQWMLKEGNPVAALYAPSVFTAKVNGRPVTITEETLYPFDGRICFTVKTRKPSTFSLWLRIPLWCEGATVTVNGSPAGTECLSGTFVEIKRTFRDSDKVCLDLPMEVRFVKHPYHGITVERGPLLFSLPVVEKETVKETRSSGGRQFRSVYLLPKSKWNYSLSGTGTECAVVRSEDFTSPWDIEKTPVKIAVTATEVMNWQLYRNLYTPDFPPTLTSGPRTSLTLVPFGCTRLRVTVFPDSDQIPETVVE